MRRYFLAGAVLVAILGIGCAGRVTVGDRAYDPYYHDYHVWNDAEAPHYNAWIVETHHRNVDYNHLRRKDQQSYWRWRHDHP